MIELQNIKRTKKRVKNTGEVFTPLKTTEAILDRSTNIDFENDMLVDIACGDGNMLEVFLDKIKRHDADFECLNRILGIDLMPDNVEYCKNRLLNKLTLSLDEQILARDILEKNIICANSLKFDIQSFINSRYENLKNKSVKD